MGAGLLQRSSARASSHASSKTTDIFFHLYLIISEYYRLDY